MTKEQIQKKIETLLRKAEKENATEAHMTFNVADRWMVLLRETK